MPRHLHPARRLVPTAAPMLVAPTVLGDVNVSLGVVGLMIAIVLLVVVLLAVIAIEVTGEHRFNVQSRHEHHG
jgi:hypothetical protein